MVITAHAITRFAERIVPSHSYDEAATLLALRADRAVPLKQKTYGGQELWKITDPDALLVVKRDPGSREGPVVVTVVLPQEEDVVEVPDYMQRLVQQCEADLQQYTLDEKVKQAATKLQHIKHNMRQEVKAAQRKMLKTREGAREKVQQVLDESGKDVVLQLHLKGLIPKF